MEKPLKEAGIEWEGWHGFRRGLATNLERIGVREAIAAIVVRHSNVRVTRKHYIKPPSIEAVSAIAAPFRYAHDNAKASIAPHIGNQGETHAAARWVQ